MWHDRWGISCEEEEDDEEEEEEACSTFKCHPPGALTGHDKVAEVIRTSSSKIQQLSSRRGCLAAVRAGVGIIAGASHRAAPGWAENVSARFS